MMRWKRTANITVVRLVPTIMPLVKGAAIKVVAAVKTPISLFLHITKDGLTFLTLEKSFRPQLDSRN
jgi:hypothetical protein